MRPIQLARIATLLGYFGLFALTLLWVTVLTPPGRIPTSIMLILFVGPLLFPLRGILNGKPYTHAWTSFLVLLYFMHGVVEAWANPAARWLAITEVLLSLILFTGCIFYVRLANQKS